MRKDTHRAQGASWTDAFVRGGGAAAVWCGGGVVRCGAVRVQSRGGGGGGTDRGLIRWGMARSGGGREGVSCRGGAGRDISRWAAGRQGGQGGTGGAISASASASAVGGRAKRAAGGVHRAAGGMHMYILHMIAAAAVAARGSMRCAGARGGCARARGTERGEAKMERLHACRRRCAWAEGGIGARVVWAAVRSRQMPRRMVGAAVERATRRRGEEAPAGAVVGIGGRDGRSTAGRAGGGRGGSNGGRVLIDSLRSGVHPQGHRHRARAAGQATRDDAVSTPRSMKGWTRSLPVSWNPASAERRAGAAPGNNG